MGDLDGINSSKVTEWFDQFVPSAVGPLTFSLIAGGHSNLTYSVADSTGRLWVLRRPPLGQVLASAHDMAREHRIISALHETNVPVPETMGLCTDDSVNGAPFYVMDFVDGTVVRGAKDAAGLSESQRLTAGESLVDVMAKIHDVDVDQVGLGDLGKKDDYIARQLKRWYGQYQKSDSQVESGLGLSGVDRAHKVLSENIPPQQRSAIVHGDYRLDNCMLGTDGEVIAVLDWEICTLGDPMADVGLLWVYWTDPDQEALLPQASPTSLPGFPKKAELIKRYDEQSDLDLSDIDYYKAFGFWKLTCIIAGVYARYAGGAMGDVPEEQVAGFKSMREALTEHVEDSLKEVR